MSSQRTLINHTLSDCLLFMLLKSSTDIKTFINKNRCGASVFFLFFISFGASFYFCLFLRFENMSTATQCIVFVENRVGPLVCWDNFISITRNGVMRRKVLFVLTFFSIYRSILEVLQGYYLLSIYVRKMTA